MNLRPKKTEELDVNITPLIDVVFLLLIFFMITTTFQRESQIKIDLPKTTTQSKEKKQKMVELSIDVSGNYYVDNQRVVNSSTKTLIRALNIAKAGRKNIPIRISADAKASHQSVVTAMDAAGRVGFKHMSISTLTQKPSK